jgi:plastocyanin
MLYRFLYVLLLLGCVNLWFDDTTLYTCRISITARYKEKMLETSMVRPRTIARAPLSALTNVTIAALVGIALALVYVQAIMVGRFELDLTIFAAIMLIVAGVIAIGWRWGPLLGTLMSSLVVVANSGPVIYDLTHPEGFHAFAYMIVAVGFAIAGTIAGISATVQNYRARERRTLRWLPTALVGLAMLGLGAILVGAIPREAGAGVSPEVLAGLPAVTTPDFRFDQAEVTAKVGETVALRLDNPHGAPHSFDIDELNIHVPMAVGKSGLALFKPTKAGTYTFYCGVPGHRELGMEGKLIVEP